MTATLPASSSRGLFPIHDQVQIVGFRPIKSHVGPLHGITVIACSFDCHRPFHLTLGRTRNSRSAECIVVLDFVAHASNFAVFPKPAVDHLLLAVVPAEDPCRFTSFVILSGPNEDQQPGHLPFKPDAVLTDATRLAMLKRKARRLGRPKAALEVVARKAPQRAV